MYHPVLCSRWLCQRRALHALAVVRVGAAAEVVVVAA